jgi:hypothetical protein
VIWLLWPQQIKVKITRFEESSSIPTRGLAKSPIVTRNTTTPFLSLLLKARL